METITTQNQIERVNTDVHVRIRHHAQPVLRVAQVLIACILGNPSLGVEAMNRTGRYGYCYKITTPSGSVIYITYDHATETVFIKDKMRYYTVLHTFDNDADDIQIVTEVRGFLA